MTKAANLFIYLLFYFSFFLSFIHSFIHLTKAAKLFIFLLSYLFIFSFNHLFIYFLQYLQNIFIPTWIHKESISFLNVPLFENYFFLSPLPYLNRPTISGYDDCIMYELFTMCYQMCVLRIKKLNWIEYFKQNITVPLKLIKCNNKLPLSCSEHRHLFHTWATLTNKTLFY